MYVYACLEDQKKLKKLKDSDLTEIAEASCTKAIYSLTGDAMYIYGDGEPSSAIGKYRQSTLSLEKQSPDYGGQIHVLVNDDSYIYAGGATICRVKRYLKSDMSFIDESLSYGGTINALTQDTVHLYVGGEVTQTVWKLLKSDLSKIAESSSYGGMICALAVDNDYIYVGGDTPKRIKKYLKSDLAYVAESADLSNRLRSIASDSEYIYTGGMTPYVVHKLLKSNLSKVAESPAMDCWEMGISKDYIYVTGWDQVYKLSKTDLSIVGQSQSYNQDYIEALWVGGMPSLPPPPVELPHYVLEVHEPNGGNLVCMLENAHNVKWSQRINELDTLTFSLPSGDPKAAELIGGREIWLYRRS